MEDKMVNKKNATIMDVAKMSGVSKGTVDRVIHNRGEVSEDTIKKVKDTIAELGFTPNIHASMLSSKQKYSIIVVMPNFQQKDYWNLVHNGIEQAKESLVHKHISIDIIYFNLFDSSSFCLACELALEREPNGMLLTPLYKDDAIAFVKKLNKKKIPVVFIDSKLEGSNYLAYYGMPEFESGYLAANLLLEGCGGNSKRILNIRLIEGAAPLNESIHNKLEGFSDYINKHHPETEIVTYKIAPGNYIENIKKLDAFFVNNPDIDKIITFHSRAYMVAEWMELRNINNKYLIGFDGHQQNIEAVKKGFISTLISERAALQTANAVDILVRNITLKFVPQHKDNYASMDILNKYNVDFY